MRTSEAEKVIKNNPHLYLEWLKIIKGTGIVNECRNGKLWRSHRVKNGIDNYTVYDLKDHVIKKGVAHE
jgi:hypothetical protein